MSRWASGKQGDYLRAQAVERRLRKYAAHAFSESLLFRPYGRMNLSEELILSPMSLDTLTETTEASPSVEHRSPSRLLK